MKGAADMLVFLYLYILTNRTRQWCSSLTSVALYRRPQGPQEEGVEAQAFCACRVPHDKVRYKDQLEEG